MGFCYGDTGIQNLARVTDGRSRSITAENFNGDKGKGGMSATGTGENPGRDLGKGWKISPSIIISANSRRNIAIIKEAGCIEHIWMATEPDKWRRLIVRMYWDAETIPSVEVPLGDLFCNGRGKNCQISSLPVCVNPCGGFNLFFPMPFSKGARIEIENQDDSDTVLYYQIDYELRPAVDDMGYFHAQFRMSSPTSDGVHTIIDNVLGKGHYVGTYMAIQVNNNGWWGEGEVKFYLDGDKEFPTICGTGTEDYFGGAWNFEFPKGNYCTYTTPYMGMVQVLKPDGLYQANTRFGMYRFHIPDPVRFDNGLKVTIQDLGWRANGRYLKQKSNISTVAYWYQKEPHCPFPDLPDRDELEII